MPCCTAACQQPWEAHTGWHKDSAQRSSPHFRTLLPPKVFLSCMCWFHQRNLKQLTVSPLRPRCRLNTPLPNTSYHTPLWVSLPSVSSPLCVSLNLCWFTQRRLSIKAGSALSECLKSSQLIDLRGYHSNLVRLLSIFVLSEKPMRLFHCIHERTHD